MIIDKPDTPNQILMSVASLIPLPLLEDYLAQLLPAIKQGLLNDNSKHIGLTLLRKIL